MTKDSVNAIAIVPNDQQVAGAAGDGRPTNYTTGQSGTVQDALTDTLAAYEHTSAHQTYGRDIDLEFVVSSGDDESAQRADAVAVKAKKPFVVVDSTASSLAVFDTEDRGGEDPRVLAQRHARRDPQAGSLPLGADGRRRGHDERRRVHRQTGGGQEGAVRG